MAKKNSHLPILTHYHRALRKIESEHPDIRLEALVYEHLRRTGRERLVCQLMTIGRPPKGQKSRTQLLLGWLEGRDPELAYLAGILTAESARGIDQQSIADWAQLLIKTENMTPGEAAYYVERVSRNTEAPISYRQALTAWKRVYSRD